MPIIDSELQKSDFRVKPLGVLEKIQGKGAEMKHSASPHPFPSFLYISSTFFSLVGDQLPL